MLKSSVRSDDPFCNGMGSDGHKSHVRCDGTPCAVKVACTVWVGGKVGDYFKDLPIDIIDTADPPAASRRLR